LEQIPKNLGESTPVEHLQSLEVRLCSTIK
jgi:hypothetical protein